MKKGITGFLMLALTGLLFQGCALLEQQNTSAADEVMVEEIKAPGSYDSADTAIFVAKDEEKRSATFYNINVGKNYTLTYDGTTAIRNKHGQAMTMTQMEVGNIVDITFLKDEKKLSSISLSTESWTHTSVDKFEINEARRDITIGSGIYRYQKDLAILAEGKLVELMDINAADILTVSGIDNVIYSIIVDKGHGYLRLNGDENLIGGWIEVGQELIRSITDDMLLVVPEGNYDVFVSNKGVYGAKNVSVRRNEEVTLDFSDLEVEEKKTGVVVFSLNPSDAALYVDGTQVDTSGPVTLTYGIHQLYATADGYSSSRSYLKVGEPAAGITVTLDKLDSDETDVDDEENTNQDDKEETTSDNNSSTTVTGNDTSSTVTGNDSNSSVSGSDTTTTSYYQIHVDSPSGVEVYLDGNYIGVAPASVKKSSGNHVITLRKSGYVTRSYTVNVDTEKKDVTYSFVELEKENE